MVIRVLAKSSALSSRLSRSWRIANGSASTRGGSPAVCVSWRSLIRTIGRTICSASLTSSLTSCGLRATFSPDE